jgi:hypothetical protein
MRRENACVKVGLSLLSFYVFLCMQIRLSPLGFVWFKIQVQFTLVKKVFELCDKYFFKMKLLRVK